MGCAGAKANAVSTAVAQKVRAQRERSRQKFARGPKSETGRQSFASLVHALAPVLEEQESRRGVIWSQSEDCFQSLSVDPDSFNEGDLEVLRERPWQQMWRIHLQEYEDGANQLQEDTELPAMDTLLETMRDGNDEAVKAFLPQLKRFRALQRLLSLQEDLASLARKVALSLASEAQWPQLALVLQKSGAEVQASNLLSMALTGFHLQGVFFRMVVDEDDWKTICAEVRMARQSKGPLLLALEGMGVRLLASPVLNECAKDEASIKRTSRILLDYCQQLRYGHQEETELWKAAQKLPNPRKLLSLEVPLARAIGALPQSLRPSVKASECLALVFGVPPGELTSLRCGKPEVLVSDSTAGLLEEVATCLRCLSWRLKRSDVHGLFGCPCEVWYLPEAEGDPAAPAIWEWQSNRFAVLFTSAAPQFPLSEDSSSLVERLHSVAQQLSTEPGMAQHGRALRSLLREQQLPARFAPAVAELKLLGVQHLLVKNQALVEEAASVELMSRAAKHAVRHILTHRQMLRAASSSSPNGCNGCAAEVFFGQLGPKRKEVVDTPLQRLWAVDADGDWMQLIAKEAQLLSTEDSIGADAAEAPIPPIPPQEKREVKSDEAELEAQLMLSALQVNPDATSEEQMQLAALRQGLLQVVFWVRLASMAHELSLTAAEPRDKDPSRASSVSTAESEAPRTDLSTSLSLLRALGHRLMAAARRRPLALAAATAGELRISLPREFTIRLRVHALQLNAPMRVPIGPSATTSSSSSIQLHFRCTAPLSYEEAFSEVLQADLPGDPAKPLSASGKLAALLLTNRDLSLGRGRVGLLQRSPELLAPSVSVVWKLAAATAVLRPGDATTAYGVKHKAWTAKTLLQVVHYQLLSSAADSGNQEEAAFLAKQLQTLKAAAQILGELGISCPAELFASFFTLRGMICEREGDVDACYLHYLQALARLDDAWGDPRKPGGRGHPFAAFLVWKLGLISYCRSDTKCIVKFGDYFRSLVLSFEDVPFSWGPGSSGDVSKPRCLELLRREARPEAAQWCWRHDVLNVLQEGLLPAPCTPAADELSTVANHHSITGDRQDVFRGTVFACGVNELGQLGTGRDLPWSGAPLRVVALKEVRIKEVACGEAHCIALDLEGHLHAWGFDEFCQVGGTHFVASPLSSPRCPGGRPGFRGCKVIPKPRQLQVGTSFVRVACGAQFSLALDSSGQVWSWGHGEGGVLALGPSLTARAEPTKVLLEKGYSWASWVACGSYHAFAVCEGQLYSWGRTEGGQLGLASEVIEGHIEEHHLEDSCVCLPHPVLNLPPIRSAAGGDVHSLALDETGEIYSWGWGEFGQLGLGFSSSSFQVGMGGASSRRPLPQHLPLDRKGRALQVACGGAFSAALLGQDLNDGGQLLMWGANDVGQCGLPAKKPIDIASPTEVPGLRNIPIRLVACGTCHAVAIDLNGQAFSWGAQQFGKLGRSDAGITATFDGCDEPGLLRSMARLRLARVACGLHHSLLVTEVSGRRRSSNDSTTEEGVTEVSSGSQYAKT